MARYGMVIDLHRCVSCGACALACKTENNTGDRANGQTFNWTDYYHASEGTFPSVRLIALPGLCNHCSEAPCVEECPVEPKAMYKTANGVTMHNDERCIGCQMCQEACPYSALDVDRERVQYSVISFNDSSARTHRRYHDASELVPGCTTSGVEIAGKAGSSPPYRTNYRHPDYGGERPDGVTEKCILCDHRLADGLQPYCVAACPSEARVVGDLDDPRSEAATLLRQHEGRRLKNNRGEFLADGEKGTLPNVYYIRKYSRREA